METRYPELDNNELIHRCKRGETRAFEQIYYRYRDELLQLAWKFTDQFDFSTDIVESIFIELAERIEEYDDSVSLRVSLYRNLLKKSQSLGEDQEETEENDEEMAEWDTFAPEGMWAGFPSEDRKHELSERTRQIKQYLFNKPVHVRLMFLLRYLNEIKARDIHQIMEQPEEEIQDILSQPGSIKQELAEELSEEKDTVKVEDIDEYIAEWKAFSPPPFPKEKESNILRAGRRMTDRLHESDYEPPASGLLSTEQDLTDLLKMIPLVLALLAILALIPVLWNLFA